MKKLLIFVVIAMFSWIAVANAQELETGSIVSNEDKGRFQYGVTLRYGGTFINSQELAIVFAGGYRFNRRNYLGLNIGVANAESGMNWDFGYQGDKFIGSPISLDYIHYFPVGKTKRHSIYLGGELGYICSFGQSFLYQHTDGEYEKVSLNGAIAVIKLGMDHPVYKKMHLNWGIRLGVLTAGVGLGISF